MRRAILGPLGAITLGTVLLASAAAVGATAARAHGTVGSAARASPAPAMASAAQTSVAPAAGSGLPARIVGLFRMTGEINTAVNVRGERPGQTVTRDWTFVPLACESSTCRSLVLTRQRAERKLTRLILKRKGTGQYSGWTVFYAALSCNRRIYRLGEVVPYTISLRVTRSVTIEGIAFASGLSATYTNRARIDRTPCPLGPSHDAATYTGIIKLVPSPPVASFSALINAGSDGAAFTDTSTRGAGGSPVVSWSWQFGDPASGSANTAGEAQAVHVFSAPGTYVVTLTVVDANGLTSTSTRSVSVPGSPSPSAPTT